MASDKRVTLYTLFRFSKVLVSPCTRFSKVLGSLILVKERKLLFVVLFT